MSASTLSLTELVDLSLGTPEVVNYKGLRTLLLAIVSNLKLSDVKAELNDADKQELLAAREASKQDIRKVAEDQSHSRPASSDLKSPSPGPGLRNLGVVTSQGSVSSNDPYLQNLEHKVSKLENQMEALNSLPSNENLMQRVSHRDTSASGTSNAPSPPHSATPVSEMWQLMQVQKKAAANEEGVGKVIKRDCNLQCKIITIYILYM